MSGSLSYSDAVKLLGGDGGTLQALNDLAGGALLAATAGGATFVLSLFDVKGELARLSGGLVTGLRDRLSGLGRFDRTERLEAAYTVIVLSSYFEAVAGAGLPDLGLRRSDQLAVAGGAGGGPDRLAHVTRELLRLEVPGIAPHRPHEASARRLAGYYAGLSASLCDFVSGLAVWDTLDDTGRARFRRVLTDEVPARAVRRQEEQLRRLASDFPEVAFWLNLTDHRATREELRSGLAGLEEVLTGLADGRVPDERRRALSRGYRRALERGVIQPGDVPDGIRIPALGEIYVDHRFRVAEVGRSSRPDREDWWQDAQVRDDLYAYLLARLTSPDAVRRPLLLLGQPGSGKSVLTTILAARLPASDFLVVRVALREVPADADLQSQIEYALRDATGEDLRWPALARTAGGALPVVLLDGFDELLLATGVSRSDYLERIVRFQQREADQGRPAVVVVTSRTAVADRVRIPAEGAVGVRLEPFDDTQVRRWLTVWNRENSAYLSGNGLRALPAATVLAHPELASQPLLLMMLALYDADGNALQRGGAGLDRRGLYERLIIRFAEREIAKAGAALAEPEFRSAVDDDLFRLSVAAFGMLNRGRQWVTEEELDADLTALLGSAGGQAIVGRFFFVHQAQALHDGRRLTTCEFLHSTFGEYLVARLVLRELAALAAGEGHDDGLLYALLSFIPLSARRPIVDFLVSALRDRHDGGALRATLIRHFLASMEPRALDAHPAYSPVPVPVPVPARHAAYSANLLLLTAAAGGTVTAGELFPWALNPVTGWRRHAMLWRSQLSNESFFSVAETLTLRRFWRDDGTRDLGVSLGGVAEHDRIDLRWTYNEAEPARRNARITVGLPTESAFLCSMLGDTMSHALAPWKDMIDVLTFPPGATATSPAHLLADLMATAADEPPAGDLVARYDACLAVSEASPSWNDARYLRMVFRQLVLDAPRLPGAWLEAVAERFDARLADDAGLRALMARAVGGSPAR